MALVDVVSWVVISDLVQVIRGRLHLGDPFDKTFVYFIFKVDKISLSIRIFEQMILFGFWIIIIIITFLIIIFNFYFSTVHMTLIFLLYRIGSHVMYCLSSLCYRSNLMMWFFDACLSLDVFKINFMSNIFWDDMFLIDSGSSKCLDLFSSIFKFNFLFMLVNMSFLSKIKNKISGVNV